MKILETNRLFLRPYQLTDADEVAKCCNNETLTIYLPLPFPYSLQMAQEWINSQRRTKNVFDFAIINKETNEFIGSISITLNNSKTDGEAGYWIKQTSWGNGFATEALDRLLKFAFEELKIHKVFAKHFVENPASGRVMQKCGMTPVGTLKSHYFKNGEYHDSVLYEIINKHD